METNSPNSAIEGVDWRINPPTVAWWGGCWESLIRLLKQFLRKTLGKASLTYEELETVLCDCESVINSMPLTYVSEDVADLAPITPNMFLMDLKEVGLPDCDAVDSNIFNRRAKYRQEIKNDCRKSSEKNTWVNWFWLPSGRDRSYCLQKLYSLEQKIVRGRIGLWRWQKNSSQAEMGRYV